MISKTTYDRWVDDVGKYRELVRRIISDSKYNLTNEDIFVLMSINRVLDESIKESAQASSIPQI